MNTSHFGAEMEARNIDKYITRGVEREIPLTLQLFMWQKREELAEKDYLQVFNLKISENYEQVVEHLQEIPEYKREYIIDTQNPISAKVFIIDDETHITMLLAEEY